MKRISLLGCTGSVGRATLDVVRHLPNELQIVALAAGSNLDLLERQVREFHPAIVAVGNVDKAIEFQKRMPDLHVVAGEEGLCEAAAFDQVDLTLLAMAGNGGLKPALCAIEAGKQIAIANKEILVCAGELIMLRARNKGVKLLPVDSEHCALFQCLQGNDRKSVRRLILTASGGPFRSFSHEMLASITIEQALFHPNWQMGPKITVDSSTLMNKGLELIEARYLFDCPISSMDVIIHPQSIIHSLVEYCDGSMLAQMSEPTMALPIQYALTFPKRQEGLLAPFDFLKHPQLTFEAPDRKKFPCLMLAEEALRLGLSYPCFINAANEVLVNRFLNREIRWVDIAYKLEKLMSSHQAIDVVTLEAVLAIDHEAREKARKC
jgi:1-deoxy-D-xylulose-5-phosphate reductoisomerase